MDDRTIVLVGDKVKEQRCRKAWTQKKLAEEAGVSRKTIENVEGNKNASLLDTVHRIAEALEVDWLTLTTIDTEELPDSSREKLSAVINSEIARNSLSLKPYEKVGLSIAAWGATIGILILSTFLIVSSLTRESNIDILKKMDDVKDKLSSKISTKYKEEKSWVSVRYDYLKSKIVMVFDGVEYMWSLAKKVSPIVERLLNDEKNTGGVVERKLESDVKTIKFRSSNGDKASTNDKEAASGEGLSANTLSKK